MTSGPLVCQGQLFVVGSIDHSFVCNRFYKDPFLQLILSRLRASLHFNTPAHKGHWIRHAKLHLYENILQKRTRSSKKKKKSIFGFALSSANCLWWSNFPLVFISISHFLTQKDLIKHMLHLLLRAKVKWYLSLFVFLLLLTFHEIHLF